MNPITVVNKYTYTGNNPVSRTDPSGMSWVSNFWDHNNEWTRDIAVAVVTVGILMICGAPALGALTAVGTVAGGALLASMAIASRQGGNFWDNTASAFHTNFRIAAAFLALSGIASATFGGGIAGAGGNGLNGWVQSKNSFFLPKGYEGDLTMGPAALFNGTMRFASHSFGHTLQFIGIGLITGDTESTWKYFLGIGLIGTTPMGNFWERGADYLGGI